MPSEHIFTALDTKISLRRYPIQPREQLRAWDAADEYLLSHIDQLELPNCDKVIIFNDGFGALSIGMAALFPKAEITCISDSLVSQQAAESNIDANSLTKGSIKILSSFEWMPEQDKAKPCNTPADLLLIKVPKSLAQLEANLRLARSMTRADTLVIGAGMVKKIHKSTLSLFEECIGPTRTSLAHKKSRLIFSQLNTKALDIVPESPAQFIIDAKISQTETDLSLVTYPGVFCHGSLDYGTRFMLESMKLPRGVNASSNFSLLDLGCGSGVLGLVAGKRLPGASVVFVDESLAAIASVKENIESVFGAQTQNQYQAKATNCLDGIANNSCDLILNNPPFHDASAKTKGIALTMFKESKRVLKPKGQLQVIANRNLGYHRALKDIFGNCTTLNSNSKFVVLCAAKI